MSKKGLALLAFICALLWLPASVHATTQDSQIPDRVTKAATVVRDVTSPDGQRIPDALLQRAVAMAVIPGGARGLLSERLADGRWTAPIFIQVVEGSWRGASSTDLVLIFTNADALRTLEEGTGLKLGVDASILAGPLDSTGVATDAKLETAIYAYARSNARLAGIALDGAALDVDVNSIHQAYGQNIRAKEVLLGETILANATVKPFIDALQHAIVKTKVS